MRSPRALQFRKLQESTTPQITTINKHHYVIPARKLTKRKANGVVTKLKLLTVMESCHLSLDWNRFLQNGNL